MNILDSSKENIILFYEFKKNQVKKRNSKNKKFIEIKSKIKKYLMGIEKWLLVLEN